MLSEFREVIRDVEWDVDERYVVIRRIRGC